VKGSLESGSCCALLLLSNVGGNAKQKQTKNKKTKKSEKPDLLKNHAKMSESNVYTKKNCLN